MKIEIEKEKIIKLLTTGIYPKGASHIDKGILEKFKDVCEIAEIVVDSIRGMENCIDNSRESERLVGEQAEKCIKNIKKIIR